MASGYVARYDGKKGTTWRVRLEYTDPETGARCQPWESLPKGSTERDATAYLHRRLAELHAGDIPAPARMTVRDLLLAWLDTDARARTQPTTLQDYEVTVRVHLLPAFGSLKIGKLTTPRVQGWLVRYGEEGHGRRVIEQSRLRLRQAYDYAIRMGYVSRNPVAETIVPRSDAPRYKVQPWTGEQVAIFFAHSPESTYHPLWHMLVLAGMRRGEALGLRWTDVVRTPAGGGIATVRQQVRPTDGSAVITPILKTPGSYRTVALDAEMMATLAAHKAAQNERRMRLGPAWREFDLIHASAVGTPINPNNVSREFLRLLEVTGLPRIRVHDLRHTCGTLLHEAGVDLKTISAMLGHAKIGTTADIYIKSSGRLQAEAADALRRTVRGDRGAPESRSL